jgi:hypothetical protein
MTFSAPRIIAASTVVAYQFINCVITSIEGDVAPVLFDDAVVSLNTFTGCTFHVEEDDFTFFRPDGAGAALTMAACQVLARQNGVGVATLFDTGASPMMARGLTLNTEVPGVGSIDFGSGGSAANWSSDSYVTQSGATITGLPFVSNYAGALALARSITAPSTPILGSDETETPFDQTLIIPAHTVTRVGDVIEIKARVKITRTGALSEAFPAFIYIGGKLVIDQALAIFTGNGVIDIAARILVTDVTAALGKVRPAGTFGMSLSSSDVLTSRAINSACAEVLDTLDFTIDQLVEYAWRWDAGTADTNEAQLFDFEVRVIRAGYN